MSSEEATSVRVALRIRPQLAREKIEACRICTYVTPGEPQVTIGKDKSFTYDYVFDTPTEQQAVYETCVKNLVEGCFEGYNATVLAYGQTGSGKTYTMGTGFDVSFLPEQLGIIPRAVEHLFRGINKRKDEAKQKGLPPPEFSVSAQFLELYNEELIDLFDAARDPSRGRSTIRIHEDASGSIYTVGVTSREVSSSEETMQCLQTGALNRTTAATRMNSQSSRSHAIFSVFIKQTRACKLKDLQTSSPEGESGEKTGETPSTNGKNEASLEFETLSAKFHFTDLAGSERLKRTGATGDRAKEGISINCGLLALGNVISALGDPGKRSSHVPYRDSKLTRLLQDSLGGNSCTLMVACISPSDSDFMETLSTLNYANRARNIKNKVVANQDTASKQIQVLRQQLAALQLELTEYKTGKRIVGEDGVEAYNDMFQENNILQKEVNNFRMKIKAMQETLENRNQQVISLRTELDKAKLGGGDEDKGSDVVSLVENYVKEIEDLRSKLVESESLCSSLRRRSDGLASYGFPCSPTPSLPMTGSIDFENTHVSGGKSIIDMAKDEIDKLAAKKDSLKKRKLEKIKEDEKTTSGDADESKQEVVNGNETNGYEQSTTDEEESEMETIDSELSDDDDDGDEASETLQKEFASITYEIDVKQQLVNELESQQRRISSMQRHYEDKLKLMAETIRATELERDKVLKNLDTKSGGISEKSTKIKADYQRQIDKMKKEMNKLQEVKKKHDRLMREQSRHTTQLKSLRNELEQMKKAKTRLMKQMKEEQKKNKAHETKRMREIMKLKREMKMKANEVRTLTSKNRQKDLMVKRKQEEVAVLRKQLKPISGKYGKQQQLQQLKQHEAKRPLDSTYFVDKSEGGDKVGGTKRVRKASSEFSSRTARLKLKTLQSKISEAVVRRETISNIDRQMERLLKQREQLQRDIERQHRKQSKAVVSGEDETAIQRLKEEEDNLQQTIDFVNEQIQECQLEIMQVEEAEEDNGVVSSVVQYCSINEARYIIENLISTTVNKSAVGVQMQNRLQDMETRLNASEESAKQAHDLMRYILQERPNLDSSIAECLSEYMKGAISDSASSRESSPGRMDDDFFQVPKIAPPQTPFEPLPDNNARLKPQSKEIKARRRTATPQELLHGLPSPISSNLTPIGSPLEERTILAPPDEQSPNLRSSSTPECQSPMNKTVILGPSRSPHNGVHENDTLSSKDDSQIASSTLHATAVKSNSSPSSLPNPIPSDSPPGSPVSSRMKSSVASNVFSRLTTYALSSPRTDNSSSIFEEFRGRMNPNTGKNSTPRGAPLICSHTAEGHHKPVLCVEATDHLLFSGSKDRTVKVWNLVTCQEIMTLSGHPNNVNVVRYCTSTGLVYTVSLCYIKVWDIRSQAKCVRVISSSGGHQLPSNFTNTVSRTNRMPDNESLINDVRVGDEGRLLFCASTTNVKIWDLNKFSIIGKLSGHSGNIMTMVVPPNKKNLVITGAKDHFIKIYDLSGGVQGLINPSETLEPPHMDGVESLAYSVDDKVLFSGSRDKSIKKWDLNTKAVIKCEYQAHRSWVCALDITRSDDGDEMLVSGGRDGVVKLWDLKSFGSIGTVNAHQDTVNDITSNKNNIFTASSDRTVSVWKQS